MSSLLQDINSNNQQFLHLKGNAIRLLGKIVDSSTLPSIERYLKQSLSLGSESISSAVMLVLLQISRESKEVLRHWISEITNVLSSGSTSISKYHAMIVYFMAKQNDLTAMNKIVAQSKSSYDHPYTLTLIQRIISFLDWKEHKSSREHRIFKSSIDMTTLELLKGYFVNMIGEKDELSQITSSMKAYFNSKRQILRFAMVKLFNLRKNRKIYIEEQLEKLLESQLNDENPYISTLTVGALLRTKNVLNIQNILEKMSSCLDYLTDDFKNSMVSAIRTSLNLEPSNSHSVFEFLQKVLRSESSFECKLNTVNAIIDLTCKFEQCEDSLGLVILIEFLEDCEFPEISLKILNFIGEKGPFTKDPSRFVLPLINRLVLDGNIVRFSAIGALTKFAINCENLKESIISVLLEQNGDYENNIRERILLSVSYIDAGTMDNYGYNIKELERKSEMVMNDKDNFIVIEEASNEHIEIKELFNDESIISGIEDNQVVRQETILKNSDKFSLSLEQIIAENDLGELFKTNDIIFLTEPEAEFVVGLQKFIFEENFIVFKFTISNTMNYQIKEVCPKLMFGISDLEIIKEYKLDYISANSSETCFTIIKINPSKMNFTLDFKLSFKVKEGGGSAEEYRLETFWIREKDFIRTCDDMKNVKQEWENKKYKVQISENFILSEIDSIRNASDSIQEILGLKPITDDMDSIIYFSGTILKMGDFLLKCRFIKENNILLNLNLKCNNEEIVNIIFNLIQ